MSRFDSKNKSETTTGLNTKNRNSFLLVASLAILGLAGTGCRCMGPTSTCLRPNGPILQGARGLRQGHLQRNHMQDRIVPPEHYQLAGQERFFNQHPNYRFLPVPSRNIYKNSHAYPGPAAGQSSQPPGQTLPPPGSSFSPNNSSASNRFSTGADQDLPPGAYMVPAHPSGFAAPAPNLGPIKKESKSIPGRGTSGQQNMKNPVNPNVRNLDSQATINRPQNRLANVGSIAPATTKRPQLVAVTHNEQISYPYNTFSNAPVSAWVHNQKVSVDGQQQDVSGKNNPVLPPKTMGTSSSFTPLDGDAPAKPRVLKTGHKDDLQFEGPVDPSVSFVDPEIRSQEVIKVKSVSFGPTFQSSLSSNKPQRFPQDQTKQLETGEKIYNMFPYYPISANSHSMYQQVVPSIDKNGTRRVALRHPTQNPSGVITTNSNNSIRR